MYDLAPVSNRAPRLVIFASLALAALPASAATFTVVKWGEVGGDPAITSGTAADNPAMNTTFTPGATVTDPTTYYGGYNPLTDTPLFNGAGSHNQGGVGLEIRDPDDSFYYPIHFDTISTAPQTHMFAWETSTHTLTSGGVLNNFTVESRLRDSPNSGSQRFLIEEGGSWFISQSNPVGTSYGSWSVDPATLSWFSFTPFSAGVSSIGAAATPSFQNYTAVGLYNEVSTTSGWADIRSRFFQVTAEPIPEPSRALLLTLGTLALLLRRRRP